MHRRAALLSFILACCIAAVPAWGQVTVTPSNLNGWQIIPDGTVPINWTVGTAAIGVGSLQFGPIDGANPANKFIMTPPYTGLTSDFVSLSYEYYIDALSSVGGNNFYVNMYVDSSANGIGTFATWYDCRYDYVPAGNTFGAWNTGSVASGSAWTNVANPLGSCTATIGALPAGSEIMFVVLNGGQSTAADAGLMGGFDNVIITTSASATVYDFEPDPVDIELTHSESIDPVVPGSGAGNLVYVVTATNNGPGDASGLEVSEVLTLPAGVTIDSIVASTGTYLPANDPNGVWNIGSLANGLSATLTITLTVDSSTAAGTDVIQSSAQVTSLDQTDSAPGTNASTEATSVAALPAAAEPVPTLGTWALMLMAVALAGVAMRRLI